MNITQISLRNFRSWESLDLEIEPSVTLLAGPNGSGKSAVIDAMLWAMYGSAQDAGRMIRRGTDEAMVQIEVATEYGPLTIRRTVRRSGASVKVSLHSWIDGESISAATATETQHVIEDRLGVSQDVLRASAFATQHEGSLFAEAKPAERKHVLGEVLSLGMWEQLAGRARGDLQDAKYQAQIAQALVEQHDGAEGRLAGVAKVLGGARADLVLAEQAEAQAENEAARLATEAESAREARRLHAAAVEAAERARSEHERATADRAKADETLDQAKAAVGSAPLLPEAAREAPRLRLELQRAEATYESEMHAFNQHGMQLHEARKALKDLTAESETGACARCGQALHDASLPDRLDETRMLVDRLEQDAPMIADDAALRALRQSAQAAQERLNEALTVQKIAGSIEALRQSVRDAMGREMETAEHLRLAIIMSKPTPVIDDESDAKHLAALDALTHARIAHLQAAQDLATAEAAAAQAELDANAEADARTKLAAAQHDAAIADILAQGFGPNGVPALVIDNVLGQLADESNRVLAELGTPIRVDLRSQRVTQAGKLIDALDIIVLAGVEEAPYETLSGGERTRVALALRAALTRLLAAKSDARVRLLVIDEPSGLDAAGAEAFADVLQAFITARIFDTALIVTHDERLADRIDRVIRVTKTPGGSSRLAENSTGPASPSIPSASPVELQEVTDA